MRSSAVRGFFAGSGLELMNNHDAVRRLLQLTGRLTDAPASAHTAHLTAPVRVAYLGTATYDLPDPQVKQTQLLQQYGCEVQAICVADPDKQELDAEEEDYLMHRADIVLVSGGNTLYAIRRWEELNMVPLFRALAEEGRVILAGGSAGAICWFTSGHSDSADPSSYMKAMLQDAYDKQQEQQQLQQRERGEGRVGAIESENVAQVSVSSNGRSAASATRNDRDNGGRDGEQSAPTAAAWDYIRVHGMNLLPGLVCPHYDKTQSNGVRRAVDFHAMMRRHPTERGVAIDHWAALVLPGDGTYEVFSTPGKKYQCVDGAGEASAAIHHGVSPSEAGGASVCAGVGKSGHVSVRTPDASERQVVTSNNDDSDNNKSSGSAAATRVGSEVNSAGMMSVEPCGDRACERGEHDDCVARSTDDAPSVFTLDVMGGAVRRTRAPRKGLLCDLLREPNGPLTPDPFERYYAMANSTPSSGSLVGH